MTGWPAFSDQEDGDGPGPEGDRLPAIRVPAGLAGVRLDRALAELVAGLSRSRLKTLIHTGHVRRAGHVITDPAKPVKQGDTLCVTLPPPGPARPPGQAMPLTVLHEDRAVIVIDKPAGLVVHPAPGNPDRTLVNALIARYGDVLSGVGGEKRPGIVHRLDKDTSGIMVVARTDAAHRALAAQFAAHSTDRCYRALVWGEVPRTGRVAGLIGRDPGQRKRMAVVGRNGKWAGTHFWRLRLLPAGKPVVSLVACRLETGRTHQIRVHMASLGHPVVGDSLYGGRRRPIMCRQALHAASLAFDHPSTGSRLSFASPLPPDMMAAMQVLDRGEF